MWITHKLSRDPDGPNVYLRWNTSSGLVKLMSGDEGAPPDEVPTWYLDAGALTKAAQEWLACVVLAEESEQ